MYVYFFIWRCLFNYTKNSLTKGTLSYSILTTQWIYVRGFIMSWDTARWHWAMACRNRKLSWMFALCSYQTKIELIPYYGKCKSSSCVFTCNTTSIHFKRQYCLLFFNMFCILRVLLSQNSNFILFIYVSNSDISLNRFLL